MESPNRIKSALHLDGWNYHTDDKKYLQKNATLVTAEEYTLEMKGCIFCPECCVGLFRSPKEKNYDSAGRKAFYAHDRKHTPDCSLRVKKAEGKIFKNEEQARQAIENEELVIVKEFRKQKPLSPKTNNPKEYQGDPIEDRDGGISEVQIGRHIGDKFKLQSHVETIKGLCRNFDKNLHRYFVLPRQNNARTLQDLLVNINTVTEICDDPKIYFGKITESSSGGNKPENIRLTMFEYKENKHCRDFCLKVTNQDSKAHGIDDASEGKIILMYGKVTANGIGLCIERLGWGEFSVLPNEYAYLLHEDA